MSLRLGDTAPDFSADTTAGPIDFHRWKPYLRLTPQPDR